MRKGPATLVQAGNDKGPRVNLPRLKWIAVVAPVAFVAAVEIVRYEFLRSYPGLVQSAVIVGVTLLCAAVFSAAVFRIVDRIYRVFIEQARQNAQARLSRAEGLHRIGLELSDFLNLDRNLERIVEEIRGLLECDLACWAELDPHTREIYYRATVGNLTDVHRRLRTRVGQGFTGRAVSSERVIKAENFPDDTTDQPRSYPFSQAEELRAAMSAPVVTRQGPAGAILVGQRRPRIWTVEDELVLRSVATQAGVALENHRLYTQVHDMAALEERARLAGEIHDGLAQLTAYVSSRIKDVPELVEAGQKEEALELIGQISHVVEQAHLDVRQAIFDLRQSAQFGGDLVSLVGDQLYEFGRRTRIETELVLPEWALLRVADEVRVQVIRIIQEGLSNIAKHALASRAWVTLECVGVEGLRVVIRDNGRGFSLGSNERAQKGHYGLAIMGERTQSVGGTLRVTSEVGKGTRIEVLIPNAIKE